MGKKFRVYFFWKRAWGRLMGWVLPLGIIFVGVWAVIAYAWHG